MEYSTKNFWLKTFERAVKTFAQTLAALIGVDAVRLLDIDWPFILEVSATACLLSVLTSIASSGIGERNTPGVVVTRRAKEERPQALTSVPVPEWNPPAPGWDAAATATGPDTYTSASAPAYPEVNLDEVAR